MEVKFCNSDSQYDDMQRWLAYLRRHNANIFNVFFKDKDDITDEGIIEVVKNVSKFFALPVPALHDKCETIAKVMTSSRASECELYYNRQLMEKAGINNHDTLALAFVHELSHEIIYQTRFMLFENELWSQELAADMMVGAFSAIGDDVATGKYKYVLRQLSASLTHPDGKLRASIVKYGREYITQLQKQGEVDDIREVLKGLPAFVYAHYQELQESWSEVQLDDDEGDVPTEATPIDYEALLDTNLLKQYYLKHKERKEDDIENLWKLFESALDYVSSPTSDKLVSLSRCFDIAINIKYNGKSKITMGLFWINPDVYLNLDDLNVNYIYNSGNIPASVVENLPKINTKNSTYKISATEYFDIIEILRDYLQSDESELKTFYQLSWEAFKYSQKVKEKQKSEKTPEKKLTKHVDNGSEGKNVDNEETEKTSQKYSKKDFLEDVYMDEKDYDTLARLISKKKNVILQGAPGVGKTYVANRLAYSIMNVRDEKRVMMIQLHQNYSYEDFIMGFRPSDAGFELKYGPFYKFCKKAKDDSTKKYFFIIDEINRSNLSKILGELFMLIENDKRGSNFKLKLLYNDEDFYVPENVYIIGMMNTADRSLAMLDYALRRRFAFFEMKPGFNTDGFQKYCEALNSPNFNKLIQCVKKLNSVIAQDDSLGEGFCLGHSFFCNLKDVEYQDLSDIVEYELIPLLREYWFDEPGKVKDWSEKLRTEIK